MQEFIIVARDLANGLDALATVQKLVSAPVPGAIPVGTQHPSKDAVRTYTLALMVEVAEWVQTLDYKPWKNSDLQSDLRESKERVADEFADILAFLGILVVYMEQFGINTEDIAAAYAAKSAENVRRITRNLGNGPDNTD